jgi:hypothetical protein
MILLVLTIKASRSVLRGLRGYLLSLCAEDYIMKLKLIVVAKIVII